MDGRSFVVRHDPARGLCLTIDDTDFDASAASCNDGAPLTLGQGAPRFSAEVQGSLLAFGYLPENATAVVAVFDDGRRVDDDVVSNSSPRVWALPLPLGVELGDNRPAILYVAADGTQTPAPKV
jgi:hypothetical protein